MSASSSTIAAASKPSNRAPTLRSLIEKITTENEALRNENAVLQRDSLHLKHRIDLLEQERTDALGLLLGHQSAQAVPIEPPQVAYKEERKSTPPVPPVHTPKAKPKAKRAGRPKGSGKVRAHILSSLEGARGRWRQTGWIADAASTTKESAGNHLRALVKEGLVKTRVDTQDKRRQQYSIALTTSERKVKEGLESSRRWLETRDLAGDLGLEVESTRRILVRLAQEGYIQRFRRTKSPGTIPCYWAALSVTTPAPAPAKVAGKVDEEALSLCVHLTQEPQSLSEVARKCGLDASLTFDMLSHLESHRLALCSKGAWLAAKTIKSDN